MGGSPTNLVISLISKQHFLVVAFNVTEQICLSLEIIILSLWLIPYLQNTDNQNGLLSFTQKGPKMSKDCLGFQQNLGVKELKNN